MNSYRNADDQLSDEVEPIELKPEFTISEFDGLRKIFSVSEIAPGYAQPASDLFVGFNFLYLAIKAELVKKADLLVAFTHFLLVKLAKLRCVGLGETNPVDECMRGIETLPPNWNASPHSYRLRYARPGEAKVFLLKADISEGVLLLNLICMSDCKIAQMSLDIESRVWSLHYRAQCGCIKALMPTAWAISKNIRRQLIDVVIGSLQQDVSTQTPAYLLNLDECSDAAIINKPTKIGNMPLPVECKERRFTFGDIERCNLHDYGLKPGCDKVNERGSAAEEGEDKDDWTCLGKLKL